MKEKFASLECALNSDVIVFYGAIIDGVESTIKDLVEDLKAHGNASDKLYIVLTTNGGSLNPVERMTNIFRHFYQEVNFIVPDYAYSAGTIWCMSGDNIFMNYNSVLGPVDPQVQNKDGKLVAALGYLDKINEMIEKSRNQELSQAEIILLNGFDLAELRTYEQAKELAVDLIKTWLVKYKFKDWTHHKNGVPVTLDEKEERAKCIADILSDNNRWKSHGRPIDMDTLSNLKLKIINYTEDNRINTPIAEYHELMVDYITKYGYPRFIQTRRFL